MRDSTRERALQVGKYMVETRKTVREIGKDLGWNKSTIHMDLRYRLPEIDRDLAEKVHEILEHNKSMRHINGGNRTKEIWENLKGVEGQ